MPRAAAEKLIFYCRPWMTSRRARPKHAKHRALIQIDGWILMLLLWERHRRVHVCVVIKSFCQRLKVKVGLSGARAASVAQRARVLHIWSIPVALFCVCATAIHTKTHNTRGERCVHATVLSHYVGRSRIIIICVLPPRARIIKSSPRSQIIERHRKTDAITLG